MAQNSHAANADECEECGTTENVQELTLPEGDATVGHMCDECLNESVSEMKAELDEEARQAAEAFAASETTTSRENLSPNASHVRRVVEETTEAFLRDGRGYGFLSESLKVWNEGDYGDGYGVVFTLPFQDEEVRHAFFESTDDDEYYEGYPEGVASRLNSGYVEWVNGFTFEYIQD